MTSATRAEWGKANVDGEGEGGAAPGAGFGSAPGAVTIDSPPLRTRLGEELPVFCERCGYSLHGLPQARCDRCTVLQYKCPECGHHQPINTLRPAFQRILGRARAFVLACWVFFKLNYFGWLLFAWFAMGVEWSYRYNWVPPAAGVPQTRPTFQFVPREIDEEVVLAFGMFALPFGMVSRMFLLRWRRGWLVGLILAALVVAAVMVGAYFRQTVFNRWDRNILAGPLSPQFSTLTLMAGGVVVLGAVAAWPVWMALVHLFLPTKTANALLDWQRAMSGKASALARE